MNYLDFQEKPKNGYGWIYKYTSPSGKSYIGQTTYSLYDRARKNGSGYKNCTIFYRAIEKYGLENFKVEILEEVVEEQLITKEAEYIKLYNTLKPNGYNTYPGGCGSCNNKLSTAIDVYDLELNFLRSFDSIIEAAKLYNVPYQAISQCINHKINHYKNKVYVRLGERPVMPHVFQTRGRKTAQYDLQDNLIAVFNSANEAAIAIGKDSNAGRNIRLVCAGKRLTAYGFKWKFLD